MVTKLRAASLVLLLANIACRHPVKLEPLPLEKSAGWFQGACFAISNPDLARGAAVDLIAMGEPQRILHAKIGDQISSATSCAPLAEGRREQNAKPETSFYNLEAPELAASDIGIGLLAPQQKLAIINGLAQTDLNSDGRPEVFSSCATTEGINFTISTYQGPPLWTQYYYMGYDMEPTCR